jgi:putative flippase GtrA
VPTDASLLAAASRGAAARLPTRELGTFLAVGGAGYVTDVVAFNWLRDRPMLGGDNPIGAKIVAVAVAMVITYLGNRLLTWRDIPSANRRREIVLFTVFNLIGLVIAVLTLDVSHNILGLTSRLADNVSGNGIGVGLGTAFRYWSYRRFVFAGQQDRAPGPHGAASREPCASAGQEPAEASAPVPGGCRETRTSRSL